MTRSLRYIATTVLAAAVAVGMGAAPQLGAADQTTPPGQAPDVVRPAGPQIGQPAPGQRPGGPGRMGPGQGQRPGGPGGMGPAQGQRGRGAGMRPGQGRGPAADPLALTDDQRAGIETLRRATRDQSAAARDELEYTRRTLHREVFADKRDSSKIASLAARIATLERQIFDLELKTQTAVSDLLTPAQREAMRLRGDGPGAGRGRGMGMAGQGRGRAGGAPR